MAKISQQLKASIPIEGEDVIFTLRKPTNKELNEFMAARYDVGKRNKLRDNSREARIDFFDLLLVGVDTLEDDDGPIDVARKDAIPANWKNDIIFSLFEDTEVSVKN